MKLKHVLKLTNHGVSTTLLDKVIFYMVTLTKHLRKPHIYDKLPTEFRNAMEACSDVLKSIAMKLLNSMGKILNIDPEDMVEMFEVGCQSMRINYYPPCPEPDKAIDLSKLLQLSEMEGLQVRKDGTWITVKPLPYTFVVNIGDILEIITNGSEHRAIRNSVQERISIATFLSPLLEQEFGPAPSLLRSGTPPRFLKTTTANYYKGDFSRSLGKELSGHN